VTSSGNRTCNFQITRRTPHPLSHQALTCITTSMSEVVYSKFDTTVSAVVYSGLDIVVSVVVL